jgi:hypothetical protein
MDIISGTIGSTAVNQIVSTDYFLNKALIFGYKNFSAGTAGTPTNNSSGMFIGFETGACPILVGTGSYFELTMPLRNSINAKNMYVKGAVGDGYYIVTTNATNL